MSTKSAKSPVWLKLLVVLGVIVAVVVGVILYTRPNAIVETVVSGDAIDAKSGSVTVKEEYTMQMKSEIGGRVLNKDYHLEPDLRVKEGDVLVHLDPGDIQIEIEGLQNTYNSVKQRMDLGSAQKFVLETAKSEFENADRMFKLGQLSDSEYQIKRRAVETAKQALELEKVRDQEDLNDDENKIKTEKRALEKMTVTAPFDGTISEVYAHPGDLIQKGDPIVSLITNSRIVEAKISEEDFANIKVGQDATIIFLPYGEFEFKGIVKKILPVADAETQRKLVQLVVTDIDPDKLVPGYTGEVSIVVGRHAAKAIVPRRALLNEHVYVVKDGKVELRPVKTGFVWLTGAEIVSGLDPGEQVIVEDLETFRDGDRVRVEEIPSDAFSKKK
jgi:RND family efflux transporter MFP subunit